MRHAPATTICGVLTIAGTAVAVGPEWCEPAAGDAGALPAKAISITGPASTSLVRIDGQLGGFGFGAGDFQDMFLIYIADPDAFSATIGDSTDTTFDTQLWTFYFSGKGIIGNDDHPKGGPLSILPTGGSDDGTNTDVEIPGLYYLAISGFNSDPIDPAGAPIFIQETRTEISGPDGSNLPITDWQPPTTPQTGTYQIFVEGVSFIFCPADLSGNGDVDFADILTVIAQWGPCPAKGPCPADLDGDNDVAFSDILVIIEEWGRCEGGPE
ncbi:MAG: hypothetical protein GY715_16315 [Planctomycetes bacterium]|nr:hypothetical protein [Planctomycetota bacterium]